MYTCVCVFVGMIHTQTHIFLGRGSVALIRLKNIKNHYSKTSIAWGIGISNKVPSKSLLLIGVTMTDCQTAAIQSISSIIQHFTIRRRLRNKLYRFAGCEAINRELENPAQDEIKDSSKADMPTNQPS